MNIVNIKNEYLQLFVDVLTPQFYNGVLSLHRNAKNLHKHMNEKNISCPTVSKLFQMSLKDLKSLSPSSINIETTRITNSAKCSEWIEDLFKTLIKLYLTILTNNSINDYKKFIENIKFNDFVHMCYIECSYYFCNDQEEINSKTNSIKLIKIAIVNSLKKILPIKTILYNFNAQHLSIQNTNNNFCEHNIDESFENKMGSIPSLNKRISDDSIFIYNKIETPSSIKKVQINETQNVNIDIPKINEVKDEVKDEENNELKLQNKNIIVSNFENIFENNFKENSVEECLLNT